MNVFAWSAVFIVLALFLISIIIFVSYLKGIVDTIQKRSENIVQEQQEIKKLFKQECESIIKNLNELKDGKP